MALDYLAHIRDESARFAEAMRDAPADAQVPTCPDWRSDDLLWHLAGVQWFWGRIVRDAVQDPESLAEPERPGDRAGLLRFFHEATELLQESLAATPPEEPRWTWAPDKTAGFILRRQAHEALVHRVDAELTADVERLPMDPVLSGDGVDEALRVMFGGCPPWGHIEPEAGSTLRIRATDTGASWLVTLSRFTGTDPDGTSHDEPDITIAATDTGEDTAATISGTAGDLDCWLWGRPTVGALDRAGDDHSHPRFLAIVAPGLN